MANRLVAAFIGRGGVDAMADYRFFFDAMACHCEIRVVAPDEATAGHWATAAIAEVHRIEHKYSRYRNDSVVGRINAAAGQHWVDCDEETLSLLAYAESLFHASAGLFDITSGVLRKAWDFRNARLPDADFLRRLCAQVDWNQLECEGMRVRLARTDMEIDFGGFGKEYAADRAASVLVASGATGGYVNLAGDVCVMGPRPNGDPWAIGIQHPRNAACVVATIPVHRGGLATSGDYERYFEHDGKRYCHVLDPRTGYPVTHWQSVSALAPTALAAGSCTTIAMLKQAQAIDFLEKNGLVYVAVDAQGKIHRDQPRPSPDDS